MQIRKTAVVIDQVVISAQVAALEVLALVEAVVASVTAIAVVTVTAMVSIVEVVDHAVATAETVVPVAVVMEEDLGEDVAEDLELAPVVQECGTRIERLV